MPDDNSTKIAATIAAAVEALELGLDHKANAIVRQAVHSGGITPAELLLGALAADPVEVAVQQIEEGEPMLVTYDGPDEGVHLAPSFGGAWMPRGQEVDLPHEVAEALLDQPTFRRGVRGGRGRRVVETPEKPDPTVESPAG